MRIVLIKTGALGDVVRTTSIALGLQRQFNASITWVTDKAAIPILNLNGISLVSCEDNAWQFGDYDWIINLEDDLKWCKIASTLPVERRSGGLSDDLGNRYYSDDLSEWFGMGLLARDKNEANRLKKANQRTFYEMLYDGLGLERPVLRPKIVYTPDENWDEVRNFVGINTGAGARWKYKKWGEEQTAELCKKIHSAGFSPLLIGGIEEEQRNAKIAELAGGCVVSVSTYYLTDFAALISKLRLLVTSDSLALHLATAQHIPVVAFFGPTSGSEIDLFGLGEKVETELPCGRCYLSDCNIRPHCMESITVDRMWTAVKRQLGQS